ncbi:mid1-interacting protein 1A-like [Crassostrea virginica]|uniref:Mid1-interacting protein 1A-like n=1 Tax=Crassostrea virginica TaxID=6565 RepID=A0A8B8E861_CRAVI|nr:mid1-interacting protein 1A-like [Crassostrea virginica]
MSESSKMNTVSSEQKQEQSLLTVLNKFVQAVNVMDETVMIPSRLKDMEMESAVKNPEIKEENNNMAIVPIINPGTDLYSFYKMLNTIKKELISGKPGEEEQAVTSSDSEDDSAEDSSKQTAELFRHHLQGLFSVMNQLTNTAKALTDKYESEFVGEGTNRSISSFAI